MYPAFQFHCCKKYPTLIQLYDSKVAESEGAVQDRLFLQGQGYTGVTAYTSYPAHLRAGSNSFHFTPSTVYTLFAHVRHFTQHASTVPYSPSISQPLCDRAFNQICQVLHTWYLIVIDREET